MKPMLCQPMPYERAVELMRMEGHKWLCQEKYDGVRAYIENGRIYDRRQKEITDRFPELVGIPKLPFVIDGELICDEFNQIAGRMHTKAAFDRRLLGQKHPATFMAFDVCIGGSLSKRMEFLEQLEKEKFPPWMKVAPLVESFDEEWKRVLEETREGLVLKNIESGYQYGKRSPDWLKVKAFQETTAIFTKLDEHPKGVRLETDDGRSVNVNGAQAEQVRRKFEQEGKVECEVQYLPQAKSDAWRFPSFRGLVV